MKIDWFAAFRGQLDRFWSKVDKNGPEARPRLGRCWLYGGRLDKDGYGRFMITSPYLPLKPRQKCVLPHRMVWQLKHGPISSDVLILHRCDTRNCCRLSHLFAGDQAANIRDMVSKERHHHGSVHYLKINPDKVSGEKNPSAKLTADTVRAIYRCCRRGMPTMSVAVKFGASKSQVKRIRTGRAWWCVTGLTPIRKVRR